MNSIPGDVSAIEGLPVPAHRDPEEYRNWLAEQQRRAAQDRPARSSHRDHLAPMYVPSSHRRGRRRFAILAVLLVLGLTLIPVGFFASDTLAGALGSSGETAGPASVDTASVAATGEASSDYIVPPAETVMTDHVTFGHLGDRYVVAAGDSLERIALELGTTVEELLSLNELDDANQLLVGMQLAIPASTQPTHTAN